MSVRKWHNNVEYRIVWCVKGSHCPRKIIKQQKHSVLAILRWLATDQPWMGVRKSVIKRAWFQLATRMNWPFADVAGMKVRQVVQGLRDTRPKVDWIRVEQRQVGEWTEMLDPLTYLKTPNTVKGDAIRAKLLAEIDAMSDEELNAFRWTPKDVKVLTYEEVKANALDR